QSPCLAKRLWCSRRSKGLAHESDRRFRVGAPGPVHRQRARATPGANPVADLLALETEGAGHAFFVGRPVAVGKQEAMCDPDGRQVEDRAEMKRQPGASQMVTAGCVHEQEIRLLWKGPHRRFE